MNNFQSTAINKAIAQSQSPQIGQTWYPTTQDSDYTFDVTINDQDADIFENAVVAYHGEQLIFKYTLVNNSNIDIRWLTLNDDVFDPIADNAFSDMNDLTDLCELPLSVVAGGYIICEFKFSALNRPDGQKNMATVTVEGLESQTDSAWYRTQEEVTDTSFPTSTVLPTDTSVPPTPTYTPTSTNTPTHTPTSTSTPTSTFVPPTSTSTLTSTPTSTTRPQTATPTATLPSIGEDDHEPNHNCANVAVIDSDSIPQTHTFHEVADTDWTTFTAPTAGTYRIEITIPDNSRADVDLYVYTSCDTLSVEQFVETFAAGARLDVQAEAGQTYYIEIANFDSLVYGPDVAYNLSVRKMPSEHDDDGNVIIPGPAIVVAGRYRGADSAQDNIDQTALHAYDLFKSKGRNDSEIFFLATNSSLGAGTSGPIVDGQATERNLELGITQWAKEQLERDYVSQVLTLYLVDHGGPDEFYLDRVKQEVLTSNNLDTWLSELEDEFPDLQVNVIIEACKAGSFIDRRDGSISSEGRIIITSSNEDYDAYTSRYGAAFSDEFIRFLWEDHNLFYSFQASSNSVQQHHRYQQPWLDADGDGDPNEADDFAIASERGFANAGTLSSTWPPYIASVDVTTIDSNNNTLSTGQPQLHANVRHQFGNDAIQEVWGVVYPPDYVPPTGDAAYEEDGELNTEALDIIEFTAAEGTQAQYISDGSTDGELVFTQMGVYRIVVYARDRDGLQARPVTVEVDMDALNGYRIFLPTVSR
ncbi:MAG: C13 family peptidase [Chloroflexota bacterium]